MRHSSRWGTIATLAAVVLAVSSAAPSVRAASTQSVEVVIMIPPRDTAAGQGEREDPAQAWAAFPDPSRERTSTTLHDGHAVTVTHTDIPAL